MKWTLLDYFSWWRHFLKLLWIFKFIGGLLSTEHRLNNNIEAVKLKFSVMEDKRLKCCRLVFYTFQIEEMESSVELNNLDSFRVPVFNLFLLIMIISSVLIACILLKHIQQKRFDVKVVFIWYKEKKRTSWPTK